MEIRFFARGLNVCSLYEYPQLFANWDDRKDWCVCFDLGGLTNGGGVTVIFAKTGPLLASNQERDAFDCALAV